MEQIETVSKAVDDASKERLNESTESNVVLLRYNAPVEKKNNDDKEIINTVNISDNSERTASGKHGRRGEILVHIFCVKIVLDRSE